MGNGRGVFCTIDGRGKLRPLRRPYTDWRDSWTQIVPGYFGANEKITDLLFYDKSKQELEFWTTDGQGEIDRLGTTIKLPLRLEDGSELTPPSQIVPGNFDPNQKITDLLFYDNRP